MTEAEWFGCTDPRLMVEFLRGKVSHRKLRLFAVWCCRRIWHLLWDERLRWAVALAERLAEAQAGPSDRKAARRGAQQVPLERQTALENRVVAAIFHLPHRD